MCCFGTGRLTVITDFDDMKYKTGNVRSVEQDKTKKPVSDAVFGEAAVVSHFIAIVGAIRWKFPRGRVCLAIFERN